MTQITIDTDTLWNKYKLFLGIAAFIVLVVIAGVLLYNAGRSEALTQIEGQTPVTPVPTPAPSSQYPKTITITASGANGPPNNMFPEIVDLNQNIYDISSSGSAWENIILGAEYDVYVTGSRQQFGETIFSTGWISLVSYPSYYYGNAWYAGQPGSVYSNRVFWDSGNNCYWLFESDNRYHCIRDFNAVQGYQITQGLPPVNMEVW
jgi:hypothetical protein